MTATKPAPDDSTTARLATPALVAFFALIGTVSFFFYNISRTMGESFGFDAAVTTLNALRTAIPAVLVGLLCISGFALLINRRRLSHDPVTRSLGRRLLHRALFLWTVAVALGVVVGEASILHDEAAFRSEVRTFQPEHDNHTHVRSRAWPNRCCALLYSPARGFWATE